MKTNFASSKKSYLQKKLTCDDNLDGVMDPSLSIANTNTNTNTRANTNAFINTNTNSNAFTNTNTHANTNANTNTKNLSIPPAMTTLTVWWIRPSPLRATQV